MLFVRRVRFIDSAEESRQWLSRTKTQWDAQSALAVRVHTTENTSLGSTIPKPLRHYAGPPSWWGFSWVEEGEGETRPTPLATPTVPTVAPVPSSTEAATNAATEAEETAPAPPDSGEDERIAPEDDDEGIAVPVAASEPQENGESNAEHPVEEATEAEGDIETDQVSVPAAVPATDPVAEAAPMPSPSPSSASGGDEDDFNPPEQRQARLSGGSSAAATGAAASGEVRTVTVAEEECIPFDISSAVSAGGLVVVEVVAAATGKVVATLPVDVSAAFRVEGSDVQHYALIMTPCAVESVDDTTIRAVLELSVVHTDYTLGQADATAAPREGVATITAPDAEALVAGLRDKVVPVVPVASGVIACSTTDLFFPTVFLGETGAFVVSNVVVVESRADAAVTVELVTSGGAEGCLEMSPSPIATLARRGERGYFALTWNVFKPITPTLHVHLLVRVGEENYPSVDMEVHVELPRPGSQNPPYCFWLNTTPVTNISFSEGDLALMQSLLPVYRLTELLNNQTEPSDGAL